MTSDETRGVSLRDRLLHHGRREVRIDLRRPHVSVTDYLLEILEEPPETREAFTSRRSLLGA